MKITKKFKGMLSFALTAMLTLGTVNVNAETANSKNPALPDPDTKGSITIHKYEIGSMSNAGAPASGLEDNRQVPEGAKPLENVEFKIYKVDNDTTNVDQVTDNNKTLVDKITTNKDGQAKITNLDLGVYYVEEVKTGSIIKEVDPFLVSIPMAHPTEENSWLYDVHVYPKNVIDKGRPTIDKSVTTSGNKHDSANIGQNVKWIIEPQIPKDIATAVTYKITDKLDEKLTYTGNLKVSFIHPTHGKIDLHHNNHYTTPRIATEGDGRVLEILFTDAGKQLLAEALVEGEALPTVKIEFTTKINQNVIEEDYLGKPIYNNANLVYTNTFNEEISQDPTIPRNPEQPDGPTVPVDPDKIIDVPESQRPEVHTGGLLLEKVDASNHDTKLEGAKFKIYPTLKDAKAGTNAIVNPANKTEEWEVTTDTNGRAIFNGLSYGAAKVDENGNLITAGSINTQGSTKYWIVETVAPTYNVVVGKDENDKDIIEKKQYNLLKAPLEVTVNATSHLESNKVVVENRKFTLPVTGGVGTVIFTLGGLAIMAAAAFLYMRTTRRA